jgi:putative transcriptional regulator
MNLNLDIFKIKTNHLNPRKGRILIAEPFLPGDYFNRSIIFIVEHTSSGTVGFILNKPVDFPIDGFKNEFPELKTTLSLGGPVSPDSLYYIHTLGDQLPGSLHITNNLYWGGNFEQLKNLINNKLVKPEQVRFFLGYSGWGSGQLQEELSENSWLVADISPSKVMKTENKLWLEMVKQIGGKYSIWENFPENPSMN